MNAVFVSHPGLQHAHQLALALYERGFLQSFWSGVPVLNEGEKLPFWIPSTYSNRIKRIAIPPELRRHPMIFQALLRAGGYLPGGFSREDYAHRIFHLFDWWVAKHISKLKPKVVVAYENSAYHTFRAAKAIGARCILDAPAIHHVAAAKLMEFKQTPYLTKINHRKDEEIAMADAILTCSPMAAETYFKAGVPPSKVHSILLGSTLPDGIARWQPHDLPLHFMFAGSLRFLKSIDVILSVFSKIHSEGMQYRLSFVGGQGEPGWVDAIEKTPFATYYGGVSQTELFQKLAQADCVILPSRFDSFGMVVAEAMACGTPAIVSRQTGAKAMIEQFPQSGWIVESNVDELYSCVKERIQNRASLFEARDFALEASRHFTWEAYRERVGILFEEWMYR